MDDHIKTDYDTDFLVWLESQAALLRTKQFDRLDLEHLIEELDSMGSKERHAFKNRIVQLMMHLLKCKVQPDHISGSWLRSIREQRYSIADLMEEMPSLKPLLDNYIARNYARAISLAADETRLPKSAFPATLPFTTEQLLDPDYLP
ncbi:hypothetical protein JOD97_006206 [Duganella sp. 1411]|jgi:hypothetical protein|uniref:DUF29 domain-containing protein n=1 Tax=Duganella sp. 1411 TaxID=2806572 RepID=UPI001AEB04B5|nr:DUF29 domain-containing protein [Duganella sp. 1411]MBP1208119.1 hypothetical protein [Duganella sp. 1411]